MSGYGISRAPGKPDRGSIYTMGRRVCYADGECRRACACVQYLVCVRTVMRCIDHRSDALQS